jgi:cyclic-di-GMP phosphodiesterase TipF (flagellum assembly factor)
MTRTGAVFIGLCMSLIAASLGAVLFLSFGLGALESAAIAVAALIGFALYNGVARPARSIADVADQIARLSRGTADLARQVGDIGRRLAAVEARVAATGDDIAAAHESALVGAVEAAGRAAPAALAAPAAAGVGAEPAVAGTDLLPPPSGRFKGMEPGEVVALLRRALEASRIDLYLQPVVSLPQRKIRYYEGVTRLRTELGEVLLPADYLPYAEHGGLMPTIDNLLLFRCVQVLRRLLQKNGELALFCNISGTSLLDGEFFPQFAEFMEANRALAPSLIFEFSQRTVREMGPIEHESLAVLSRMGFRFSMDRVEDLRIEPRDLAERGFRFIKVPGSLLLSRAGTPATDIHPADFASHLARYGIDLIADRIESEGMVVDLLDYDVRYGQGFLFSPPRPVRAEALRGIGDAPAETEVAARETAPRPEPAVAQRTEQPSEPVLRADPAAALDPRPEARPSSGLAQLAKAMVQRA